MTFPRSTYALRVLVFALGASIVLIAPARAESPVFIQDYVSTPGAGVSGITSVACGREGNIDRTKSCLARIGEVVSLEVQNLAGWLDKLKADKVITSGEAGEALVLEQLPHLRLFIGGHLMRALQPTAYMKDDPSWYTDPTQSKAAFNRSWLEFTLVRDPKNVDSRADWGQVLRASGFSPKMPLAVGVYNGQSNTAHVMAVPPAFGSAPSGLEFRLHRISWDEWTLAGLILLGAAFIGFVYMAVRSGIVRDPTCPVREDGLPPMSLGRCQMAFWFFLVISAFYFLWLITGRGDTDTINGTVLTLIGISAGTALGSAIVSNNEATTAAANAAPPPPATIYPDQIRAAQVALDQAKAAKDAAAVAQRTTQVATLKRQFRQWRARNRLQMLLDLLSEQSPTAGRDRVIMFHRFQMLLWTLVLGVIFVSEVITKLAMPVFDTTLLTLMGISSGTYLGFRVSSK